MENCENRVCLEHIMTTKSDTIGLEKIGWRLAPDSFKSNGSGLARSPFLTGRRSSQTGTVIAPDAGMKDMESVKGVGSPVKVCY